MPARENNKHLLGRFAAVIAAVSAAVAAGFLFFAVFYPLRYKDEIAANAAENGLPPELVAALINAESGFYADRVSDAGAVGLMQILPTTANYTAQKFGMSPAVPDLFDPAENIAVGTKYLRYLTDKFGDTRTALFAYNAGEGNVTRWLAENGAGRLTETPFPATNAYADKILRSVKFYKFRF